MPQLLDDYGFTTAAVEGLPMCQGGQNFSSRVLTIDIPFGFFGVTDTAKNLAIKLPTATGQNVEGVLAYWDEYENYLISKTISTGVTRTIPGIKSGLVGRVMTRGLIWVYSETAMTVASNVFIRHTASASNGQTGVIRDDADTAKADQCKFALVIQPCLAASLCLLEIGGKAR